MTSPELDDEGYAAWQLAQVVSTYWFSSCLLSGIRQGDRAGPRWEHRGERDEHPRADTNLEALGSCVRFGRASMRTRR